MNKFTIEPIEAADFADWLMMCDQLHTDNSHEENERDLRQIQKDERYECFIARDGDKPSGYIELSTRTDYVEGSESSPVGFIESIFVQPEYRKHGLGRQLVEFGEDWARQKGYTELGSDAEMNNTVSHEFHRAVGFEATPIMTFIKKL